MTTAEQYCIAYVAAFFESENGIGKTLEETVRQALDYVAAARAAGQLGRLHLACVGGGFLAFMEREARP